MSVHTRAMVCSGKRGNGDGGGVMTRVQREKRSYVALVSQGGGGHRLITVDGGCVIKSVTHTCRRKEEHDTFFSSFVPSSNAIAFFSVCSLLVVFVSCSVFVVVVVLSVVEVASVASCLWLCFLLGLPCLLPILVCCYVRFACEKRTRVEGFFVGRVCRSAFVTPCHSRSPPNYPTNVYINKIFEGSTERVIFTNIHCQAYLKPL